MNVIRMLVRKYLTEADFEWRYRLDNVEEIVKYLTYVRKYSRVPAPKESTNELVVPRKRISFDWHKYCTLASTDHLDPVRKDNESTYWL